MKENDAAWVRMSVSNQLRAIANGFAIVASFPELKDMPIVIGESDPEGCAACPVKTDPHNAYRNGTMYSSYTAEQIARTYELADLHKVNLLGSVTWAFEFEDQPYFYGFRDLATNGLPKPVLERLPHARSDGWRPPGGREQRLPCRSRRFATSACAIAPTSLRSRAVRRRSIAVLVWNYHDDDLPAPDAAIGLTIAGVPAASVKLAHYRVDRDHSNTYEAWKKMGSPQPPIEGAARRTREGRATAGDRAVAQRWRGRRARSR